MVHSSLADSSVTMETLVLVPVWDQRGYDGPLPGVLLAESFQEFVLVLSPCFHLAGLGFTLLDDLKVDGGVLHFLFLLLYGILELGEL